ncbi:HD domain-containing protein [Verrucomicrobiota bacterium]
MLDRFGLLEQILPEVAALKGQEQPPEFHPEGDVFKHTVRMLNLMTPPHARLALALLLHDVGKPPTARIGPDRIRFDGHASAGGEMARVVLERLRFPADDTNAITECIRGHMRFMDVRKMKRSTLRRFAGSPDFPLELEVHRLDCQASHGDLANYRFARRFGREMSQEPILPEPWITGHDVLELGLTQGPDVGRWLRVAYDAQLDGRFRTREELWAWIAGRIASPSP